MKGVFAADPLRGFNPLISLQYLFNILPRDYPRFHRQFRLCLLRLSLFSFAFFRPLHRLAIVHRAIRAALFVERERYFAHINTAERERLLQFRIKSADAMALLR